MLMDYVWGRQSARHHQPLTVDINNVEVLRWRHDLQMHDSTSCARPTSGRLATIQPDGTPQNSPVGFTYNEALGTIDIAGYRMSKSQKSATSRATTRWRSSSTTSPHATRGGCAAWRSAGPPNKPRSAVARRGR